MKNLLKSVSNFQAECPKITKDANNPFFKGSKYATLPHILGIITPILQKNGLVILQPVMNSCVITKLIHIDSGESIESVYDIVCKDATNPQQIGSAVSYARRYSISSLLNLNIDDDDDGNAATGNVKTTTPQKEELTPKHPNWLKAKEHLQTGGLIEDIERKYTISVENKKLLIALK